MVLADSSLYYGILDSGYVSKRDWTAKYDALVAGGACLIQIRAKRESDCERAELLAQILQRREGSRHPPLIINDDIELCLSYPGLGLHVGQDDLPAAEARQRLGPDRLLGLSTHSPEQALAAIGLGPQVLSYFAVGPVFPTQTKPDYQAVGLELVEFVAKQNPPLPFFCIGGINRRNVARVRAAGGSSVVTVSDALCDADTASAVRQTIELLRA